VTGASSGLGLELARRLGAAGAELVMPVRSRERGDRAADHIRAAAPAASIELRDLDLASLASVRALTARLTAEDRPIDVLVLNAGIALIGDRERHVTEDGFERHFQTNFLAHAALVLGLLSVLERSRARVVVQCSIASTVVGVRWGDLQFERRYRPFRAYGSSKTALGLFAVELARRMPGLTVALAHPGIAPETGIAPDIRARVRDDLRELALRRIGNRPAQAVTPALRGIVADLPAGAAPMSFSPAGWCGMAGPSRAGRAPRYLRDPLGATEVWALAEELTARLRN